MALQVRLVQKSGVVSLSSAVTTALHEGWQPYGSPYVTAAAAAQVMFLPDDATPAPDAEYFLASKDGVMALGTIILERLEAGWNMFGEPLETQYGPTQAMTKGKFTIFMPNLGFGDGQPGGGEGGGLTEAEVKALIDAAIAALELPEEDQWKTYVDKGDQDTLQSAGEQANNAVESLRVAMEHKDTVVLDSANIYTDEAIAKIPIKDWEGDFTRIEQNIDELYNVVNSTADPQVSIDKAKAEAIADANLYTDGKLADLTVVDWQPQLDAVSTMSVNYTDSTAADLRSEFNSADVAVLSASKSYTDAQLKTAKENSERYTDNMVEYGISQMQGQISAGTASATIYADQQIAILDGSVDARMSDLSQSLQASISSSAADTQALAGQHADMGDTFVLEAANKYTDDKYAAVKDWKEELEEGDRVTLAAADDFTLAAVKDAAVESTKLLNETMEAVISGAVERWEAGDKTVLEATQVAYRKGTFTTPTGATAAPVSLAASDAGNSRTTLKLPAASSVPDGFSQQVLNITGITGSDDWSSQCRVHLDETDYAEGYKVHTTRSVISNSFVLGVGGFATVVLDKTKKVWFYLGVATSPNDSLTPNGRNPDTDPPTS